MTTTRRPAPAFVTDLAWTLRVVTIAAFLTVTVFAALATAPARVNLNPAPTDAAPSLSDAPGTVGHTLAVHGCWTGTAPAGATAGHAVVRMTGSDRVRYVGARLTYLALDQALYGHAHGFTQIGGFCR